MKILEFIQQPWPWYVAGPLIGLTVPALLLIGNKSFGISSSLRHACAICVPANIPFFKYDWKKEIWNLFFVLGIVLGGVIAFFGLSNPDPIQISSSLQTDLAQYGITEIKGLLPEQLFFWSNLGTIPGFVVLVLGGFFVGFGSRYAGGCTSGHAISGLSNLQVASLIATCCFFIGGLLMVHFILPFVLTI